MVKERDKETGVHHLVVGINPDCGIFAGSRIIGETGALRQLIIGDYQREQLKMLNGVGTGIRASHFEEIEIEASEYGAHRREYRMTELGEAYWSSHSDEAMKAGALLADVRIASSAGG